MNPLLDNLPSDEYHYQVTVFTGMGRNCGTKSRVYVVLGGEAEDSEIRCLLDEQKRVRLFQIYNTGWSILKANIVYI